jgi:hypothetical protein
MPRIFFFEDGDRISERRRHNSVIWASTLWISTERGDLVVKFLGVIF